MENRNWQVIYVNSRSEKKVTESLIRKGVEAYIPLVKSMRQWSDRKKMVELPLLTGYVFVRTLPKENEIVLRVEHVLNFIKEEGKIAIVRDKEIERLKQLVELGYQIEAGTIKRVYSEGDKVKINSGALKNIEGYVLQNKDGRFIEILLESIGQCIRVKLPQEILELSEI